MKARSVSKIFLNKIQKRCKGAILDTKVKLSEISSPFYYKFGPLALSEIMRPDFEALWIEETFEKLVWITPDMLYQMQKTLGLYLKTHSRFLENREGSITLFNLSSFKLKVPSIS